MEFYAGKRSKKFEFSNEGSTKFLHYTLQIIEYQLVKERGKTIRQYKKNYTYCEEEIRLIIEGYL